jgi:hypothetical protein
MFIQVIQGRATNPPGIRRDLGRWQRLLAAGADGWLGSTTGITEDGWSISVVRFASEAQARRNRDRPADEAGFVQILQGHSDDIERMVSLRRDQEEVLARDAPHILGVTLAEHADRPGDFTQTTYFTSEQDARRSEQEGPPKANEPALQELRSLMTNLRYFDLRDPQLLSPTNAPTY